MESILDTGVRVILWFQQFSPQLDVPFKILTLMGEATFFLLLMPLLYWCLDRRTGLRLIFLFLVSAYVNTLAKALAGQPRPFQYDPRVKELFRAKGGGFPSGHAQNSVIVWGFLGVRYRKKWAWGIAAFLIIFIPLSRVYLGVHFPTDLLGGYVLGALLLFLYLRVEARLETWVKERGIAWQLGAACIIPALLLGLFPGPGGYAVDACATLMGFGVGAALEERWIRFDSAGMWWKRMIRFLLGALLMWALWWGLRMLLGDLESPGLYRFLKYLSGGIWVSAGGPWVFVKTGLAGRR